jgi:micrococcal nuclease
VGALVLSKRKKAKTAQHDSRSPSWYVFAITSTAALLAWALAFAYGRNSSTMPDAIALVEQINATPRVSSEPRMDSAALQPPLNLAPAETETRRDARADKLGPFEECTGVRWRCVVDGDTFIISGVRVRIADIDAPEIGGAKCTSEYRLGLRAKFRLVELLNSGPIQLEPIDRDTDRYGRKLRVVIRDGLSIGDALIKEGLARKWDGSQKPWC